MCARYTMRIGAGTVRDLFEVEEVPELEPRFNVAPTQSVPVIIESRHGERALRMMRWGLIPYWAKDPSIGQKLINAKSETAFEKPAFRDAIVKRRCLIPADGFFEWRDEPELEVGLFDDLPSGKSKTRKQPYHFTVQSGAFAFAGLYERWQRGESDRVESFTVLTGAPNELVAEYHDRMPVILPRASFGHWLARDVHDQGVIEAMLKPYPASEMRVIAVNPKVGNPVYDAPELLDPPG